MPKENVLYCRSKQELSAFYPIGKLATTQQPSIFAASAPTMSPYFVAWPASSAGMSFHETLGVSVLQYAGRHLEIPTHEQLNSPTTHFWSLTSTASQHFPREALIMSAVHHKGIGSSARSRVFIKTGQSSSTNFLRSASRSIVISFFSWVPSSTFLGPSFVAQRWWFPSLLASFCTYAVNVVSPSFSSE